MCELCCHIVPLLLCLSSYKSYIVPNRPFELCHKIGLCDLSEIKSKLQFEIATVCRYKPLENMPSALSILVVHPVF